MNLADIFDLEREESFRIICRFLIAYNSIEYIDKNSIESVKRALNYLEDDFREDLISPENKNKDICQDIIKARQILMSFTEMNQVIDKVKSSTSVV